MWHNLPVLGFNTFSVYVNSKGHTLGWVTRFHTAKQFDAFYSDGKREATTEKNIYGNAKLYIQSLVKLHKTA